MFEFPDRSAETKSSRSIENSENNDATSQSCETILGTAKVLAIGGLFATRVPHPVSKAIGIGAIVTGVILAKFGKDCADLRNAERQAKRENLGIKRKEAASPKVEIE